MNVILPTTDWCLALVLGRPEAGGGLSRQSHLSCIPINPSQSLVKLWHPVGEILISGEFLGPWLWRSGWPSCLLEEVKGSIQPIATVIGYGVPWQRRVLRLFAFSPCQRYIGQKHALYRYGIV